MRPPQLLFRWVSLRRPSSGQHLHSNYELKETILLYHGHFGRGTCSCLPTMQIKKELCPTEFHNTLLQIIQRKMSKYHWMPNKIWKKKPNKERKSATLKFYLRLFFPSKQNEWCSIVQKTCYTRVGIPAPTQQARCLTMPSPQLQVGCRQVYHQGLLTSTWLRERSPPQRSMCWSQDTLPPSSCHCTQAPLCVPCTYNSHTQTHIQNNRQLNK